MNIGCDIVSNNRLMNVNERFLDFVLTDKEKFEYTKHGLNYLYGRFAAKEAIMKVLRDTKKIVFTDIEVLNDKDGAPYCVNYSNIKISISHEKDYTIAVALLIE